MTTYTTLGSQQSRQWACIMARGLDHIWCLFSVSFPLAFKSRWCRLGRVLSRADAGVKWLISRPKPVHFIVWKIVGIVGPNWDVCTALPALPVTATRVKLQFRKSLDPRVSTASAMRKENAWSPLINTPWLSGKADVHARARFTDIPRFHYVHGDPLGLPTLTPASPNGGCRTALVDFPSHMLSV